MFITILLMLGGPAEMLIGGGGDGVLGKRVLGGGDISGKDEDLN